MLLKTVISAILQGYEVNQLFGKALLVSNNDHNHCARGFTIIELITIMIIVLILLGVGIPTYIRWMPDMNLRSAIRNIKSDMELAKSTAIRENTSCALAFNTANPGSYTVFVDDGEGGGTANNLIQDGGEDSLKSVSMPKNVTMTGASFDTDAAVGFNSRGIPYRYESGPPAQVVDLANPGAVTLKNIKNNYRRVRLTIVGLARIQRSNNGTTWQDD